MWDYKPSRTIRRMSLNPTFKFVNNLKLTRIKKELQTKTREETLTRSQKPEGCILRNVLANAKTSSFTAAKHTTNGV